MGIKDLQESPGYPLCVGARAVLLSDDNGHPRLRSLPLGPVDQRQRGSGDDDDDDGTEDDDDDDDDDKDGDDGYDDNDVYDDDDDDDTEDDDDDTEDVGTVRTRP